MRKDRWRLCLAMGTTMADWTIKALRAAATEHDLALVMEAITSELGFQHYALIHHADLRGSPPGRIERLLPAEVPIVHAPEFRTVRLDDEVQPIGVGYLVGLVSGLIAEKRYRPALRTSMLVSSLAAA